MENKLHESLLTKLEISAWRSHRFLSDRIGFFFQKHVISEFKNRIIGINSIEDCYDFSQNFRSLWYNIRPMQDKAEFAGFVTYLRSRCTNLSKIMEIGTANGGTLFLFSQLAKPGGTVISVDKYNFPNWKKNLFRSFSDKVKIILIKGSSMDPNLLDIINSQVCNEKLDLLFIDADHTYLGVKRDFYRFAPCVKDGGIIAFHDIIPGRGNGVPAFYEELKSNYESVDFKSKTFGWAGIGTIVYRK
ncbi:MAG: class I SAM-dependent methyltransferase [Candidatus Thermoplasmatota archaeon]|nr:class I SAM-dependent methyltransferase [Candidatus Thermoplasmatota archaeon]